MNYEELQSWHDDAQRALIREAERLREKEEQIGEYLKALSATDELLAEVDNLNEKLSGLQEEIERLNNLLEQKQAENDALRMQLLEVKEQKLKAAEERADAHSKATEIHNHFEPGSSAQVFNDRVMGKFTKKRRWKRIIKKNK